MVSNFATLYIISNVLVLVLAVLFHEAGHYYYYKRVLKRKGNVHFYFESWRSFGWRVGIQSEYKSMTTEQYHTLIVCGVMGGLLPIMVIAVAVNNVGFGLLSLPYLIGCFKDLKYLVG